MPDLPWSFVAILWKNRILTQSDAGGRILIGIAIHWLCEFSSFSRTRLSDNTIIKITRTEFIFTDILISINYLV